jgi:hypothetical protein
VVLALGDTIVPLPVISKGSFVVVRLCGMNNCEDTQMYASELAALDGRLSAPHVAS